MHIKKGYGYWETTHYPYGGCFRRATTDLKIVEVYGPAGKIPLRERHVKLEDGNKAVVQIDCCEGLD